VCRQLFCKRKDNRIYALPVISARLLPFAGFRGGEDAGWIRVVRTTLYRISWAAEQGSGKVKFKQKHPAA